ncbi:hypothetical protein SAMN05444745_1361, partial [Arthrobacter sp. OV608]
FGGTDELAAQIRDDVARVRCWFNGAGQELWTWSANESDGIC